MSASVGDGPSLVVREIGSFHVGGRRVAVSGEQLRQVAVARNAPARTVDLNGDYITGQCYAHFVKLARPRSCIPLLFLHGGAMTGVTWETTPDGRAGWQLFFLRAGFDTYLADSVERGRAGWSPYPQIYGSAPVFRTLDEAWHMFRIGPAGAYASDPGRRVAFPGQQFPVEHFDALGAQLVPRWTDHGELIVGAYCALLDRIGPVVIVAHSQGGNFGLELAARRPELVHALVAIEPASAPDFSESGRKAAAAVPHLLVWGDHFGSSQVWNTYRERVDEHARALVCLGGSFQTLDLPERGIFGNSHVPMMDRNSEVVARLILEWLRQRLDVANK